MKVLVMYQAAIKPEGKPQYFTVSSEVKTVGRLNEACIKDLAEKKIKEIEEFLSSPEVVATTFNAQVLDVMVLAVTRLDD